MGRRMTTYGSPMGASNAGDAPVRLINEQSPAGRVVVVGAAIVADRAGVAHVLAACRAQPPAMAGYWELPGGKVEVGESELAAVVRECREELGVEVTPRARLGGDVDIGSGSAVLRVYTAALADGQPQALEHTELRWLAAGELGTVPWLPADQPLLPMLRELLTN